MTGTQLVGVIGGLVLPGLAILISTALAVGLARRERRDAAREQTEERRQEALDRLLDVLADASLAKHELGTQEPVHRIRRFWNAVARLRLIAGTSDPELLEWLSEEHGRLAMIATAAQLALEAPPEDPLQLGSKPYLLMYWTICVNAIQETLVEYETHGRNPALLQVLLEDARAFLKAPVQHLHDMRSEAAKRHHSSAPTTGSGD